MAVFIYGGSNSLRKDGWTSHLAQRLPEGGLTNRSIGAATSLMAIFRLLTDPETGPKPGDTVIWEYALNEVNHIARGYDRAIAARNVERFIRECIRKELKLVAAIFTPRHEEWAPARDPMYDSLSALFQSYGVTAFDLSQVWRAATGRKRVDKALYKDNAHYSNDPELLGFVAAQIEGCIQSATVPRAPAGHETGVPQIGVQLVQSATRFQNSLLSVPLAAHRTVLEVAQAGRLVGVATLVFPNSRSALRLEHSRSGHEGRWVNLSTAGIDSADKPILKVFSMEMAGADWALQPGDEMEILPLRRPRPIYAESHVKAKLGSMDATQPAAFIGLVVEVAPA